MIRGLKITNFKCFEDQSINFSWLTLLAGANATGKSTVIQVLLLLRQSFVQGDLRRDRLRLNGDMISVGEAHDAIYDQAKEDVIGFHILDSDAEDGENFLFAYERGRPERRALEAIETGELASNLFFEQFTYLSAERVGPRLSYPISDEIALANVGGHGEFTAHCLDRWGTEPIASEGLAMPNESASSQLLYQTQLWMRYIAPDLQMEVQGVSAADIVRLGYKNHGPGDYLRPNNIGFGISYALPIVVAGLVTRPGSLLIVENPEAHLHPSAQSRLGEFLARTAANHVQVIIETHSDHLLNGLRLAVKRRVINSEDVVIQFFSRSDNEAIHKVAGPKIDQDGRLDTWPEGFFDQANKDLLNLI